MTGTQLAQNYNALSLCSLIQLVSEDDHLAWEQLLLRMQERMLASAEAVCRCPALAQDAVQETWLKLRHNAASFRPQEEERERAAEHWLLSYVRNAARCLQRGERRRQLRQIKVGLEQANSCSATDLDDREFVQAGLAKVPARDREILQLRYWQDCDHHDLAHNLGCSPNTARQRLHRARKALQSALLPMMATLVVLIALLVFRSPTSALPQQEIFSFEGGYIDTRAGLLVYDGQQAIPLDGDTYQVAYRKHDNAGLQLNVHGPAGTVSHELRVCPRSMRPVPLWLRRLSHP